MSNVKIANACQCFLFCICINRTRQPNITITKQYRFLAPCPYSSWLRRFTFDLTWPSLSSNAPILWTTWLNRHNPLDHGPPDFLVLSVFEPPYYGPSDPVDPTPWTMEHLTSWPSRPSNPPYYGPPDPVDTTPWSMDHLTSWLSLPSHPHTMNYLTQ